MTQTERLMGITVAARQLVTGTPCTKQLKVYGWTLEEYPLYEYRLPGGRVVREDLQAAVRDDAHARITFFLALKDVRGKWVREARWSAKQMAAECGIPIGDMPADQDFAEEEVTMKYGLSAYDARTRLSA